MLDEMNVYFNPNVVPLTPPSSVLSHNHHTRAVLSPVMPSIHFIHYTTLCYAFILYSYHNYPPHMLS